MIGEGGLFKVQLDAGPRIHEQVVMGQDLLRVLPTIEPGQVVASDDERELVPGPAFTHVGQCIGGVAGFGQVQFHARGLQALQPLHRTAHQL